MLKIKIISFITFTAATIAPLASSVAFAEGNDNGIVKGVCTISRESVTHSDGQQVDEFVWKSSISGHGVANPVEGNCGGYPNLDPLNKLFNSGASSDEVNSAIAKLESEQNTKNKEQDDRLNGHDQQIADIHNKDNEQDGRLNDHDKQISDIHGTDKWQDTRLDNIEAKDKYQDTRLDGHDQQIADIHNKDNEQDGRLNDHDQQIADIHNKDNEQDGRLNDHDQQIADIHNKDKEQDGRLNDHDQQIADIHNKDNEQDGRLNDHDQQIVDIHNKDKEQDGRLDGHDQQIVDIHNKDKEQDGRLDGHDQQIADIHNKDNEQDGRLDGHDQQIVDIHNKDKEQDGRLDGHDQQITYLQEQDRLAVKYIPDAAGNPTNTVKLTGDHSDTPVTVTNVRAGVNELDAINKKQLDGVLAGLGGGAHVGNAGNIVAPKYSVGNKTYSDVGSALSATNMRIDDLATETNARFDRVNKRVTDVRKEARAGIAGASALAGMRYDDRPGKVSLASGFGGFQDAQAMSLGIGYTTEDGVFRVNAGASYDFQGQGTAWNMGLGWTLN